MCGAKLACHPFLFTVVVELWLPQDGHWPPLIAQSESRHPSQALFVLRAHGQHYSYRLAVVVTNRVEVNTL